MKLEVSKKLAALVYRENYEVAIEPILKYMTDEKAVKINSYITKLYNEHKLYPYSGSELIYKDEIPDGIDGDVSVDDILERMQNVKNEDLGNVMPVNGRKLPFHPYIKGYSVYKPLYVPGMEVFKELIVSIRPGDGYLIVSGDYDVDGVTSQAIAENCLTAMGYDIRTFPNERRDGNGHNKSNHARIMNAIDTHKGCKCVILTDHGSGRSDLDRLKELNDKVPVVVMDHHNVTGKNNEMVTAFMNSRESEYKALSAGALVWQAMLYIGSPREMLEEMLPFAAITLISDVMDMDVWYTNLMYREGIKLGREEPSQVLVAFLESLRGNNVLSEDIIGFNIGPILNSGHRMNNSAKSVDLLTAPATLMKYEKNLKDNGLVGKAFEDRFIHAVVREVYGNLTDLRNLNKMRKMKSDRGIKLGLEAYAEHKQKYEYGAVLVLNNADENIIGIVSSSVGSMFGVPTITLTKGKNFYMGSGRAILKGFDCESICSSIRDDHPDVVLVSDGHPEAFGVRIAIDKVETFKQLFSDRLAEYVKNGKELVSETVTHTPYPLDAPKKLVLEDLLNYEPYGKSGKPHYSIMGKLTVEVFGKTKEHLKVSVAGEKAMFFNGMKEYRSDINYTGMVVTLSQDTYHGGLQMVVEELLR